MMTSGGRDGDITQLSSAPKLTTGVMNVDPVFSGALANGETFVALYKPFTFAREPNSIFTAYSKVMRWFPWERRIVPLTMVLDGDMLADVDTDWTETNATDAKTAAAFPLGLRTLRVTATSANGYVASANIPVEPSQSYYAEVTGMIASTGVAADAGTFIVYDVSNAGAITLSESAITRFEPDILSNNISTPAGCEQVQIRLNADANGDIIDFTNVIFYKNGQQRFVLPDRPQRRQRVGMVKVAHAGERSWDTMREVGYTAEEGDAGIRVLHLAEELSGQAAFYEEYVQPALFTTDASTTAIPVEELAAVAAEALLFDLQDDSAWRPRYLRAARDAAVVRMKYDEPSVVEHGQDVMYRARV